MQRIMALETSNGYVAGELDNVNDASLPIFNVERVQLQFNIAADFVAAQVANNVLIIALATGRILRIDLDNAADIDGMNYLSNSCGLLLKRVLDVDLPRKPSEVGFIRRMFLDPSASHLIISTTSGENFYLHTQSRQPKALSRLKGVSIDCIAWNPSLPTASTREILIGAADGNVYEVYIEPATEFYRREERYTHQVWKIPDGPVTGIWTDEISGKPDMRRVIIASHSRLCHWIGKTSGKGREGSASIYAELFQKEAPITHDTSDASPTAPSLLAVSPEVSGSTDQENSERQYAWLYGHGVFCGKLLTSPVNSSLGNKVFNESKLHSRSIFPETLSARGSRKLIQDPITSMTLSQWHILALVEGRIVAVNRLTGKLVYDQVVLEPGQGALGLFSDQKKNTYWLFTSQSIFEIVANDEDRDIWKIMLQKQDYDAALRYAKGAVQKDSVATASGDYLSSKGNFIEAASVWGKSSKAFEEVCLSLIDNGQDDALRRYLLAKLATYKKSSYMQRVMIATWLVQIYMAKLNSLDDMVATKGELLEHTDTKGAKDELYKLRNEYQEFIRKHKADLDAKTVYEVISSHDREEELLFYANTITDYDYVLSYWVQREKWTEALSVLNKQENPETFYRYSSVLMVHVPAGLVEIMMRRANIEPQKMIPALLSYNEDANVPLNQNQAVRYLNFVVDNFPDSPAAIHNTLISIMAADPTKFESSLLSYLEGQPTPPLYDADFALRLCIQHSRIQSCVHIYSSMSQYEAAVELALAHNDVDLAALVADRPEGESNIKLRKKLWLLIAEKKVKESSSIKASLEFLKRCDLLKIEDLIPFFPDFVVIDDFKDEICNALEEYSRHIDLLKQEMDSSQHTAEQIRHEIAALDNRYAIVEPGERCWICTLPVLSRQFFVFPCQHAFHSDCLGKRVLENSNLGKKKHIKDLQVEVSRGLSVGPQREKLVRELDGLVAEQCVLCGDLGIKAIDEPFVRDGEVDEWTV